MAIYGYLCPTPKENCCGSLAKLSAGLDKKGIKKHASPEQAMQCYSKYLVEVCGAEKLSRREFRMPNGGGIMMLSKAHSFGGVLRGGKSDEKGSIKAGRGMPSSGKSMAVISN